MTVVGVAATSEAAVEWCVLSGIGSREEGEKGRRRESGARRQIEREKSRSGGWSHGPAVGASDQWSSSLSNEFRYDIDLVPRLLSIKMMSFLFLATNATHSGGGRQLTADQRQQRRRSRGDGGGAILFEKFPSFGSTGFNYVRFGSSGSDSTG
ncbi:hypothetical protein Hanom_Chr15g01407261 [Helianthus anomalus]